MWSSQEVLLLGAALALQTHWGQGMMQDMTQTLQQTYRQIGHRISRGFQSAERSVSHMGKTFESVGVTIDHWAIFGILDLSISRDKRLGHGNLSQKHVSLESACIKFACTACSYTLNSCGYHARLAGNQGTGCSVACGGGRGKLS